MFSVVQERGTAFRGVLDSVSLALIDIPSMDYSYLKIIFLICNHVVLC
jgi:hypothetical protein